MMDVEPSAQRHGTIVGLLTAGAAGAPLQRHRQVEVVPGLGIAGDRYALGTGHWSDPRWPDQELTMLMVEVADALALAPELFRRNVVTRGVDLEALVGVTFRAGEAVLHGVRRCDPCRYLEQFTRPGVAPALGDRGGLRVRIMTGGRMRVGDEITTPRG